jgi:hypothetical protein
MNLDKEILVVIPYLAKGAQGNELELAVTGWRLFFKEPYHIVVVGDYHHIVETGGDISFIECPQIAPIEGQYLPHLDHVNKFSAVMSQIFGFHGFVYTCDDIYPTADFDIWDIIRPKEPVRGFDFEVSDIKGKKPDWYTDKMKTGELCDHLGIPRRNWVCHLPVYYYWDRWWCFCKRLDMANKSYIMENIYFNIEYRNPHAVSERLYHDEVTTSVPDIRPLGSVKWVSNANSGWSPRLEQMLRDYYKACKGKR